MYKNNRQLPHCQRDTHTVRHLHNAVTSPIQIVTDTNGRQRIGLSLDHSTTVLRVHMWRAVGAPASGAGAARAPAAPQGTPLAPTIDPSTAVTLMGGASADRFKRTLLTCDIEM